MAEGLGVKATKFSAQDKVAFETHLREEEGKVELCSQMSVEQKEHKTKDLERPEN